MEVFNIDNKGSEVLSNGDFKTSLLKINLF